MFDGQEGGSWTINPTTNKWCTTWDKLLAFALMYTALVTPYEVAFLIPQIDALFCVNQLVNLLFLVDVVLQVCEGMGVGVGVGEAETGSLSH